MEYLKKIKETLDQIKYILKPQNLEIIQFEYNEDGYARFISITEGEIKSIQLGSKFLTVANFNNIEELFSYINGYYEAVKKHRL